MNIDRAEARPDRTPTWLVQEVFDPDVSGQDFSYTIGLHDRGLPELHVWASPTDGEDPGEDWSLSGRDRMFLLNDLAFRMLDSSARPGSQWSHTYDGGDAVVRFSLGPPVEPASVEAHGVATGAQVLPLRWSLQRPPAGTLGPLTADDRGTAFERYADLLRPHGHSPPPGWELPRLPTFEPDQRFGPLTPVVLARAAQLWGADELDSLLHTIAPHAVGPGLTWATALVDVALRTSGRREAARELSRHTPLLVDHVIEADPARWQRALAALTPGQGSLSPSSRSVVAANARDWLQQVTYGALLAELAFDTARETTRLAALGVWTAGLHGGEVVPGEDWVAGPKIRRAVRKLLRPLDRRAWQAIADAHDRGRLDVDSAYNDLCWQLTTRLQTSASGMTWRTLRDLPSARELVENVPPAMRRYLRWSVMEEWASCVGALLTHRAEFSSAEIHTFVEPVRTLVPGLGPVLDKPH